VTFETSPSENWWPIGRAAIRIHKRTYFGLERKESHDVSATSEIREMYVSLPPAAILFKKKWAVQDSNWITER
jgi:hypothetical protein